MRFKSFSTTLLTLALCASMTPARAGDAPAPAAIGETTDGANFIEKMVQKAGAYDDYQFEFKMTALKKGKVVEEGRFYFKKPRLIKLVETGKFRKGAIAILQSNGKVKAKPGGALNFVAVDLSPNSSFLRSANGHPMVDSDLYSLAKALKVFLKEGNVARVTQEPLVYGTTGERVHVLEVYHDKELKDIYKRVAVSPSTFLPVEWWDYENGKLMSQSYWKSFKGNVGLTEEVFTLKGAKQI